MPYTLDTAAAAERIVAAGIPPAAARAIVAEVARSDSTAVAQADLDTAVARLETSIARLEVRLIRWAVVVGLAIAGLLFAALRLTA